MSLRSQGSVTREGAKAIADAVQSLITRIIAGQGTPEIEPQLKVLATIGIAAASPHALLRPRRLAATVECPRPHAVSQPRHLSLAFRGYFHYFKNIANIKYFPILVVFSCVISSSRACAPCVLHGLAR